MIIETKEQFKLNKLKNHFAIFLFCLFIFSTRAIGQVIETEPENSYDSILLSPDCKPDKNQPGKIFTKIEILAEFPGGFKEWFAFANKNFDFKSVLQYIEDTTQRFRDSLIIKFVVTRNGSICDINVQKGNSVLARSAIKLLKSSPDWKPGLNGGRQLNSYRTLKFDVVIDAKMQTQEIKRDLSSYYINDN